jgi:hypothetical protein
MLSLSKHEAGFFSSLLKGTRAKRFCSQKESLECFHGRRATDRRRERASRATAR